MKSQSYCLSLKPVKLKWSFKLKCQLHQFSQLTRHTTLEKKIMGRLDGCGV